MLVCRRSVHEKQNQIIRKLQQEKGTSNENIKHSGRLFYSIQIAKSIIHKKKLKGVK